MRRKDREITNLATMESIIAESKFCRMALCDNGKPYIVPLCFGYKDRTVFIHSAREGHKLEVMKKNSAVCLEFETAPEVVKNDIACKWKLRYKSVIARGRAVVVEEIEEKRRALAIIMSNYAPGLFEFSEEGLNKITVFKIALESMTCKISS
jgi:hypothetical protein